MHPLLTFIQSEVKAPKGRIIGFALLSSISHGLMLASINMGVESAQTGLIQWQLAIVFSVLILLYILSHYMAMSRMTHLVQEIIRQLRMRLVSKLLATDLRTMEQLRSSEVYTQLTTDVNQLSSSCIRMLEAAQASVLVMFCLIYIGWISITGLLMTLLAMAIGITVYKIQERVAHTLLKESRVQQASFFETLQDLLSGYKELKLTHSRAHALESDVSIHAEQYRDLVSRAHIHLNLSYLTSQSFLFMLLAVIVFINPHWVGTDNLFKFLAAMLFLIGPLEATINSLPSLTLGKVALKHIQALEQQLNQETREQPRCAEAPSPLSLNTLRFEDLHFEFEQQSEESGFHLGPLNLSLAPGQVLFIVGGNGSGKTTLLKVMTGLYHSHSGSIWVGDQPVDDVLMPRYREMFSPVFNDFHLFQKLHGLLPDPGEIKEWLDSLALDSVTHWEDGYFSRLNLSTGQRKRLAFLINRLYNRQVFVFDEFAADQDPHFRRYFYTVLIPELSSRGKTVIAITHDEQYFEHADKCVKLDYGRLVPIQAETSSAPFQASSDSVRFP